jgi:hypothetical protein
VTFAGRNGSAALVGIDTHRSAVHLGCKEVGFNGDILVNVPRC